MKKLTNTLLILAAVMIIGSPALAQDYKMTIKTNPLSALGGPFWLVVIPITGEYKVLLETRTTEKQSLQLGVSYIGPSLLLNLDELIGDDEVISGIRTSGARGQLMYKFFISRDLLAPAGFYVAPHFSYAFAKISNRDDVNEYFKATKMNINGVIGYQLITSGGFTLDIFTGLGYVNRKFEFSDGETTFGDGLVNRASVNVPFGLSFGYAF